VILESYPEPVERRMSTNGSDSASIAPDPLAGRWDPAPITPREQTSPTGILTTAEPAPSWAVVEIFGHRRHVGLVSEVEQYGAKMLRIDVPAADGSIEATLFYGGAAIFSVVPVTAEFAKTELGRMRGREPTRARPAARR